MKTKLVHFLAVCLFAGFAVGFIPTANAQGNAEQIPTLMIKVPDIEKLLGNVRKLMPEAQASNAENQITGIRMMLFGTGWIDPERCIVAGMVSQGAQTQWIALIPFLTPNPDFQNTYGALAGSDYYLTALPPQPEFTVSPATEDSLDQASRTPAAGNLVVEAAAAKLLAMAEPLIAASLEKMEEVPPTAPTPNDLSPKDMQAILTEMLAIGKQAETLRFGMDIAGDVFTLLMDIDALPGTALSSALVDPGGNTRLMDYPIDMPIRYHTRAYNMSGTMDLMRSYLETVYGQIGLDMNIDEMVKMTECFTGEVAGGINITSTGLAMEFIAVLHPGIDGEAFIRDHYLPFLERYGESVSELATEQTGKPQTMLFERTADSSVAGVHVMGARTKILSADQREQNILDKLDLEMRLASLGDLIFIASDDTKIEKFINETRNLVTSPAQGSMGRISVDFTALFRGILSLLPPELTSFPFPDNIGKITTWFDMQNGSLRTRTSFNMEDIKRLVSTLSALAAQQTNNPTEGDSTDPNGVI